MPGIILISLLYMPSPLVAAVVADRGIVKARLRLPRRRVRSTAAFILAPVLAVMSFVLLYLASVLIGGDILALTPWAAWRRPPPRSWTA